MSRSNIFLLGFPRVRFPSIFPSSTFEITEMVETTNNKKNAPHTVAAGHFITQCNAISCGQHPLHQFPSSNSVTSWRGQKSIVSTVSRHFPNSITTTCCGLVGRVANKSTTSWQFVRLQGSYGET